MSQTKFTPIVRLKSYWGSTEFKPLFNLGISVSIYPCDKNFYVSGTYYINGVGGACPQLHTIAVCGSVEEAKEMLAKVRGES